MSNIVKLAKEWLAGDRTPAENELAVECRACGTKYLVPVDKVDAKGDTVFVCDSEECIEKANKLIEAVAEAEAKADAAINTVSDINKALGR